MSWLRALLNATRTIKRWSVEMQNITPHTPQGVPLDPRWKQQAPLKAKQATDDYLHRLQSAWRGSLTKTNESEVIKARLTSDSRADALRMVCDTDEEEVWIGDGVTVRRRK